MEKKLLWGALILVVVILAITQLGKSADPTFTTQPLNAKVSSEK